MSEDLKTHRSEFRMSSRSRRSSTSRGIDFTFDLVGDGEEMPAVRSELSTQMESGRVRVHGWLDSPQVIEIMRSSEVFILASAYEGFCISLTEAMANGCTPVVSDIRSGNKQLVADRENGYIVPIGDVDAFVAKIRLLADDRERLGSDAGGGVENGDASTASIEWLIIMSRALSERSKMRGRIRGRLIRLFR
jgi:glycosyltransferase involved in cell wall biosynthesis